MYLIIFEVCPCHYCGVQNSVNFFDFRPYLQKKLFKIVSALPPQPRGESQ
jgi:hypothetical protein